MKKIFIPLLVVALAFCLATYTATSAQAANWVYLGSSHVDGQHDHDNIAVGGAAGRSHALQIRVIHAPIEFDHIVVHYGNGESETLQVRDVIRAGRSSRAIPLEGDRIVQSLELWYGKANPNSGKPEVRLWGMR